MNGPSSRHLGGFTLIEAIAAAGIMATLASLGLPTYTHLIEDQRTGVTIHQLQTALAGARMHAVAHVATTTLCPSDGSGHCSDGIDWSHGWLVYENRENVPQPDPANPLVNVDDAFLPKDLRLISSSGRKRVHFTANGRSTGSNITFTLCKGNDALGQVIVNNAGRARSVQPGDSSRCSAQ